MSAVMYIPAMPTTPNNLAYVEKQKQCFIRGTRPPDYPQGVGEDGWEGTATTDDVHPAGMHVRSAFLQTKIKMSNRLILRQWACSKFRCHERNEKNANACIANCNKVYPKFYMVPNEIQMSR
jgi:hypothetical protein